MPRIGEALKVKGISLDELVDSSFVFSAALSG